MKTQTTRQHLTLPCIRGLSSSGNSNLTIWTTYQTGPWLLDAHKLTGAEQAIVAEFRRRREAQPALTPLSQVPRRDLKEGLQVLYRYNGIYAIQSPGVLIKLARGNGYDHLCQHLNVEVGLIQFPKSTHWMGT